MDEEALRALIEQEAVAKSAWADLRAQLDTALYMYCHIWGHDFAPPSASQLRNNCVACQRCGVATDLKDFYAAIREQAGFSGIHSMQPDR
jgi:hypothetical protein